MQRVVRLLIEALIVGLEVIYMTFVCVSCYVYISSSHEVPAVIEGDTIINAYKKGAGDGINAMREIYEKEAARNRETGYAVESQDVL